MPTYEYECTKCEHRFERFQKMSDDPVKTCPKCRGKVRRLISGGSGLIFKGSGFYITDNRTDGYKKKQKSEQGGEGGAPKKESPPKPAPAAPEKKRGKGGDA